MWNFNLICYLREFVTGFHKRKKQRRKVAEKEQEKKKREKRLAERKKVCYFAIFLMHFIFSD